MRCVCICFPGIGDGGNELGMGKVKEAVREHMPNGALIACDVAADFAITAGLDTTLSGISSAQLRETYPTTTPRLTLIHTWIAEELVVSCDGVRPEKSLP